VWVDAPGGSVSVTDAELIEAEAITLQEVYLVPMDSRNVLNVLNYFPPTRKDFRYVNANWQDAMPAVGSELKSGEKYLFLAHLEASALPASFASIELTYRYDGDAYTTGTRIRVEITDQPSCSRT
jgi:hypothetical protein